MLEQRTLVGLIVVLEISRGFRNQLWDRTTTRKCCPCFYRMHSFQGVFKECTERRGEESITALGSGRRYTYKRTRPCDNWYNCQTHNLYLVVFNRILRLTSTSVPTSFGSTIKVSNWGVKPQINSIVYIKPSISF
ncbi:hypothetical protein MPTK1_4g23690 [Marchantia polymorpha subsp. ruderalis]|uniref:Uncharacterized protein n=2 Tax=Marchantia polymorpha TaxID=3197 RepID=A0AAF6BD24_MARPO|nr:hypothetical protein MARPO_0020s0132 [Marchantia polymorpha]BBN09908.1 hypothetical protein Mp_4g23690 [Marchantia polymorpha subsp. ruderalis]|eukprot:PTQ44485.1 hypothetical protein MARPO_0020s0132 [Marchantia polymorpha]